MAVWPGMPSPSFDVMFNHDEHGIFVRKLHITEHAGTHIDAPAHFIKGGTTVEALALNSLVCPAVVIDVSDKCKDNPDYAVAVADVERFESAYGQVPAGSAVLIHTGWDAFWDDPERFVGVVGDCIFRALARMPPGCSSSAVSPASASIRWASTQAASATRFRCTPP